MHNPIRAPNRLGGRDVSLPQGQSIDPLDFDQALELTESIRVSVSDLEEKIVTAYFGRAWVALDYPSWDAYVQGEFKSAPLALPREDRQTQVASLRQQGLSLRAIQSVTGASRPTIINDLRDVGGKDLTTSPITGIDGKEYAPVKPTEIISPKEQERRLREQEHQQAIRRGVLRLEELVNGWVQLKTLPDHPDRGALLEGLTDADRQTVLEIERIYKEATR